MNSIFTAMFIGGLIGAAIFLVLSLILLFQLKIFNAIGELTGRTAKKEILLIRNQTALRSKSRNKSGEIVLKKSIENAVEKSGKFERSSAKSGKLERTTANFGKFEKTTANFGRNYEKESTLAASALSEANKTVVLNHTDTAVLTVDIVGDKSKQDQNQEISKPSGFEITKSVVVAHAD